MARQNCRSLVLLGQRMFWQCRRLERPGEKTCCLPISDADWQRTTTSVQVLVISLLDLQQRVVELEKQWAEGLPGGGSSGNTEPSAIPSTKNVPNTVLRAARPALNRDTKVMDARCCRWNGWPRWCRSSHLAVATAVTRWPEKTHILSATRSSTSRRCGLGLPNISCIPCAAHSARC